MRCTTMSDVMNGQSHRSILLHIMIIWYFWTSGWYRIQTCPADRRFLWVSGWCAGFDRRIRSPSNCAFPVQNSQSIGRRPSAALGKLFRSSSPRLSCCPTARSGTSTSQFYLTTCNSRKKLPWKLVNRANTWMRFQNDKMLFSSTFSISTSDSYELVLFMLRWANYSNLIDLMMMFNAAILSHSCFRSRADLQVDNFVFSVRFRRAISGRIDDIPQDQV